MGDMAPFRKSGYSIQHSHRQSDCKCMQRDTVIILSTITSGDSIHSTSSGALEHILLHDSQR